MNSINIATKTPTSPAIVEDIDITNTLSSGASGSSEGLGSLNETSFFSGLTSTKIIAIIVILAFLGFNIFHYLANMTDKTTSFVDYITKDIRKVFDYFLGQPAKDVVVEAGEGTKAGVNKTAETLNTAVDMVEDIVEPRQHEKAHNAALSKLDKASKNRKLRRPIRDDETESNVQSIDGKGYCYVGTDRGFRTCVSVNNADECLSGDIFPTRDICINPKLRY